MEITERLRRHVEYSAKRDRWAQRAIDLLKRGEEKAGMAAAKRAEYWDLNVKALEPG